MTAVPGKTLIIQIPCFNEAETLGVTLAALPRRVEGFMSGFSGQVMSPPLEPQRA